MSLEDCVLSEISQIFKKCYLFSRQHTGALSTEESKTEAIRGWKQGDQSR